jgi:hypothetical protein
MAAVLGWRLLALTPTEPGPLPWLPDIPSTFRAHPVWGAYLAKRSQLVTDLADQVQDHVCQGDGPPAWASPGSHLSTALIRGIAAWRAANGIDPPDLRPTGGGGQLQTPPPSSGNNASTGTSPVPSTRQQMQGPTSDKQHTPDLDAGTTTGIAHTKIPDGVQANRRHPADSWTGNTAESGLLRSTAGRPPGRHRVSSLRPAARLSTWMPVLQRHVVGEPRSCYQGVPGAVGLPSQQ